MTFKAQNPHVKLGKSPGRMRIKVIPEPKSLLKRTFTHTTDGHYKFYEIELSLCDGEYMVSCRWGRISSSPQVKVSTFISEYEAKSFVGTKAREKLGKGYVETTDNPHYDSSWMSKEYVETPESKEKLDLFLGLLKI
jgi:predicted DNA-binding WGR domain protein